jgi:ABC-type lipoprotein export system ATPase subunit
MSGNGILIACRRLKKTYLSMGSSEPSLVLAFPDIDIPAGRRIALLGVSGSGKSTFLNLIAGLDEPDRNPEMPPEISYTFTDGVTSDMAKGKRGFPRHRLGFVFQEGHLIADASAGLNAALPGLLNGIRASDDELKPFMESLGLPPDAVAREAWRLSGGQKQRVAIIRALFHAPQIIFADEPTSSVDKRMAASIMRLLAAYQEQEPGRTLFWATHDLPLAAEFATDFLLVRKPNGGSIELEGPIPNPYPEPLTGIEKKIYEGTEPAPVSSAIRAIEPPAFKNQREAPYTQAKVGASLTFARRIARRTFAQIGQFGRWMASVTSAPPPLLRGVLEFFRLYRRFSDFSIAAALGLPVMMLSFVFIGLWTMGTVRDQAMSDPTTCNIVASAPDAQTGSGRNVVLDVDRIAEMNRVAPWRSEAGSNPCGGAENLVFGRNSLYTDLGVILSERCEPLDTPPKTLVATFAEPAISSGVRLTPFAGGASSALGDLIGPQNEFGPNPRQGPSLTGGELFITAALRESVENTLKNRTPAGATQVGPSGLASLQFCVVGRRTSSPPLRIGAVADNLPQPQPRGVPYDLLVMPSPLFVPMEDRFFQQAVFYTHPDRARELEKYLDAEGFVFPRQDVQRMIATGKRFAAIHLLIWIVGAIIMVAALLFLFNGVEAFMEKNARPNAVLRAYGLTERRLRSQIYWRLGAVAPYSGFALLMLAGIFGVLLGILFPAMALPLPNPMSLLLIVGCACAATAMLSAFVVWLSVRLWWHRHGNIAQELG